MSLLILPLLFAAMYFMTIRPQQQRLRNQRALVASLQAGDEVITIGGVIGRITVVGEQEVRLDVGNGMELRMARGAIQSRLAPDEPTGEIGP